MLNELTADNRNHTHSLKSLGLVLYGFASYGIGVAGLGVLILAAAGVIPLGNVVSLSTSPAAAIAINIGLIVLFGLQHSVMARPSFKQKLYTLLPKAMERSTFVWTSGLVLAITTLAWQPLEGIVWTSSGITHYLLWGGFIFGWAYLLAATFAINHWDLFGLRQTWLEAVGAEYTQVKFKENWMYRYSRHPIMLGAIIGVWCVPTMTASMLMLSIGLSLYIAVGLYFEERDLIKQWGQGYLDYKKRVSALLTLPW